MIYVTDHVFLVHIPFDICTIIQTSKSINTHILFTFELEKFNNIPVTRCDFFFNIFIYRKPVFHSNLPMHLQILQRTGNCVTFALILCKSSPNFFFHILTLWHWFSKICGCQKMFHSSIINNALNKFNIVFSNSNISKYVKILWCIYFIHKLSLS